MKKYWKQILIALIVIVLALITFVYIRAITEREEIKVVEKNNTETPSFQLKLNKAQTNELINFYLEDFQKDSKIKYTFVLENLALIQGDFELLGKTLKLYFYFRPSVLEDGNVELSVESISVGTLELPSSDILKYIAKNYKIPDWVLIKPNDDKILIKLNEFKLENGIYFSAEKTDLINDQIEVNVFIPKK